LVRAQIALKKVVLPEPLGPKMRDL
jgi:hypothetical protein